ncbi:MAG: hypothetical protein AAF802_09365 [Planctomycetota bacterium]
MKSLSSTPTRFLLVGVIFFALSFATAPESAEARGFRFFRGRGVVSTSRTYQTRSTYQSRSRSTQASRNWWQQPRYQPSGPSLGRIKGRNNWPGAIGAPDPRYQFFQDVNGYWR